MTDWCVRRAKQRQRNICYTSRLLTQCEMVGNRQKSVLWSISDMIQSSTLVCKEQETARVNWQTNIPYFQINFLFLLDTHLQTDEHLRFFLLFPLQNKGEWEKLREKSIWNFFPNKFSKMCFHLGKKPL